MYMIESVNKIPTDIEPSPYVPFFQFPFFWFYTMCWTDDMIDWKNAYIRRNNGD